MHYCILYYTSEDHFKIAIQDLLEASTRISERQRAVNSLTHSHSPAQRAANLLGSSTPDGVQPIQTLANEWCIYAQDES